MLAIKHPSHVPFGGSFRWKCPHCGVEFRHHTVTHVYDQAREHCRSNNLHFSDDEFTEILCKTTPGDICHEVDSDGYTVIQKKSIESQGVGTSFVKSMKTWVGAGFPLSGNDLADSRMGICNECEFWKPTYNRLANLVGWTGKCMKCGCGSFKWDVATEKCPIGKW